MTTPAQANKYSELLGEVVAGLIDRDEQISDGAYAQLPVLQAPSVPRPTMREAMRKTVYERDRYLCRYCGQKLILSDVLALLSVIDPARFPWHRNWKVGAIHPTFPLTIPSVDHVDSYAHGGQEDLTNLVTACWPCNTRKADLPLSWPLLDVDDADPSWLGLIDRYRALWERAGSPANYRSSVTRWAK